MTARILPLIGLLILVSSGAVAQEELLVTATGVVTSDSDSSNIFGFGTSPTPSGCGSPPASPCVSTAAGKSVVMTFVLNLSQIPPNVCANDACFPAQRAYYFTNTVPGTGWITTSDSIGGKTVPEFAPNGGNAGSSSVALAQIWLQGNSTAPYNELDLQSTQVVETTGAGGAYAVTSETSFLRIDDATLTPFLSSLSLGQSFTWSGSLDDGLSIGQISRGATIGTCTNGLCTGNQIVDAEANVSLESVTGTIKYVPEIDPASAASGLTLLLGGLLVLRGRRPVR